MTPTFTNHSQALISGFKLLFTGIIMFVLKQWLVSNERMTTNSLAKVKGILALLNKALCTFNVLNQLLTKKAQFRQNRKRLFQPKQTLTIMYSTQDPEAHSSTNCKKYQQSVSLISSMALHLIAWAHHQTIQVLVSMPSIIDQLLISTF